jgi:hypothetical protein
MRRPKKPNPPSTTTVGLDMCEKTWWFEARFDEARFCCSGGGAARRLRGVGVSSPR